jgi:hypothetical protein
LEQEFKTMLDQIVLVPFKPSQRTESAEEPKSRNQVDKRIWQIIDIHSAKERRGDGQKQLKLSARVDTVRESAL